MKRSEINRALRELEEMTKRCGFPLPAFCSFAPEEWEGKGHEFDEIRDNMLGWDITDYGLGDFDRVGFSLI
ncbi:MAG: D-lyxose/D-mannose family sugar isomerase, partial [Firmicutes bacterium]|nr:D-lyxose/D-mannose family sugar isomerase [Bacillota bacterium]